MISRNDRNDLDCLSLDSGGATLSRPAVWLGVLLVLAAALLLAVFVPVAGAQEQSQEVATDYTYEVADGQLTVTLAQPGVSGWKAIMVRDKAHCDTTRFGEGETVVLSTSEAAQSATITIEAEVNYCFWPFRQSDSQSIRYAYLSARYIEQIDSANQEAIEAEYSHTFAAENSQLTVSIEQTGVIGWRVFEAATRADCSRSSFDSSTQIINNVDTSQSVTVEVDTDTGYCFWARRRTDYIEVNLVYFSAENIQDLSSATTAAPATPVTTPPDSTPPTPTPPTPVTPPDTTDPQPDPTPTVRPIRPQLPDFKAVSVSQTKRDAKDVFEVIGNRDIVSASAVRLDNLEDGAECDQTAFADSSRLHSETELGPDAFYISLSTTDDGEMFCFQIKEDRDGEISEAYGITDAAVIAEEGAPAGGSVTAQPTEKEAESSETTAKEPSEEEDPFEISSSALFAIIIGAGIIGVLTVFFVVIVVGSNKPKGF